MMQFIPFYNKTPLHHDFATPVFYSWKGFLPLHPFSFNNDGH